MGACKFFESGEGVSAKECYSRLVADAQYEYGNDCYNGTISTTHSLRLLKSFAKYSKANEKAADKLIDDKDDYLEKWVCYYIDLGPVRWDRVSLKKETKPFSAKYKQKFVLQSYIDRGQLVEYFSADTKSAVEKELKAKVQAGYSSSLKIIKKPVKVSGNEEVASYSTEVKSFKTKPKATANTVRIDEIHKYWFVGYAGC